MPPTGKANLQWLTDKIMFGPFIENRVQQKHALIISCCLTSDDARVLLPRTSGSRVYIVHGSLTILYIPYIPILLTLLFNPFFYPPIALFFFSKQLRHAGLYIYTSHRWLVDFHVSDSHPVNEKIFLFYFFSKRQDLKETHLEEYV